MLLVRADAHSAIGSGHIMRCASFASAAESLGHKAVFAVSEQDSAALAGSIGFENVVVKAAYDCYDEEAAKELASIANDLHASYVLVDSYFVNNSYFSKLEAVGRLPVAYVDDMYRAGFGALKSPACWYVDAVINYGFGAKIEEYRLAYGSRETSLLVGPRYAPVRPAFIASEKMIGQSVDTVLVTTGSTNPCSSLEKMVAGVVQTLPAAQVNAVVGAHARFDEHEFSGFNVRAVTGVSDLSSLMKVSDMAVSAAGSTLYELACLGVPTVAVPIVENQLANAHGFASMGIGLSVASTVWSQEDIASRVGELACSQDARSTISRTMQHVVDGRGPLRAMEELFNVG